MSNLVDDLGGGAAAKFRRARRRVLAALGIGLPTYLLLAAVGLDRNLNGGTGGAPYLVAAAVLLLVLVGYVFTEYRCPACGGFPGSGRMSWPRHCQNCGVAL